MTVKRSEKKSVCKVTRNPHKLRRFLTDGMVQGDFEEHIATFRKCGPGIVTREIRKVQV
jgi:hypothetical protein